MSFRVFQRLSEGATADLFLAQLEQSQHQVVVEVMRGELSSDSAVVDRFRSEAELRRGLAHPHLARRVHSGTTASGRPYVVSEPVTGARLSDCVSPERRLSPTDAIDVMIPLCHALGYLHEREVVHGNLSPENVYMRGGFRAFQPKLLDSSLSLLRTAKAIIPPERMVRPEYLAPERVLGRRGDALSDIYGLGLMFFEMLTGAPPFVSPSLEDVRRMQVQEPVPALPEGLEFFRPMLELCLAKNPSRRFPNAFALGRSLEVIRNTAAQRASAAVTARAEPAP